MPSTNIPIYYNGIESIQLVVCENCYKVHEYPLVNQKIRKRFKINCTCGHTQIYTCSYKIHESYQFKDSKLFIRHNPSHVETIIPELKNTPPFTITTPKIQNEIKTLIGYMYSEKNVKCIPQINKITENNNDKTNYKGITITTHIKIIPHNKGTYHTMKQFSKLLISYAETITNMNHTYIYMRASENDRCHTGVHRITSKIEALNALEYYKDRYDFNDDTYTMFKTHIENGIDHLNNNKNIPHSFAPYIENDIRRNELSIKDQYLLKFYPGLYHIMELTRPTKEMYHDPKRILYPELMKPSIIYQYLHCTPKMKRILKQDLPKRQFMKAFFGYKITPAEEQYLHENPSLMNLYFVHFKYIKDSNIRLKYLKAFNKRSKPSQPKMLNNTYDAQKISKIKHTSRKYKNYFYNLIIQSLEHELEFNYNLINTLSSIVNYIDDTHRDIMDAKAIIPEFVETLLHDIKPNQNMRKIENKIQTEILKIKTKQSDEPYKPHPVLNIPEFKMKNWTFKPATSKSELMLMSKTMHICVGTSDYYHEQIINQEAVIIHGTNGKKHICMHLTKNDFIQIKTHYNQSIRVLGKDVENIVKKYQSFAKNHIHNMIRLENKKTPKIA